MADREKTITYLKAYVNCYADRHKTCNQNCVLYGHGDCVKYVIESINDALELLKEQELKVLTREELKQFVGHPCWFESRGTYMGKEGFWIIPSMFRTFYGGEIVSYVSVLMKNSDYGMADHGELGLSAYNKVWRCWSSRPTDEQRKAVKWE